MKSKFENLSVIFLLPFFIISCGPEQPDTMKWSTQTSGGIITRCCYGQGNDCSRQFIESYRSNHVLMDYINNDNIAGYFEEQNWRSAFPELNDYPDLVNRIVTENAKGTFIENDFFLITSNNSLTRDSVIFAFMNKEIAAPCDDYPYGN